MEPPEHEPKSHPDSLKHKDVPREKPRVLWLGMVRLPGIATEAQARRLAKSNNQNLYRDTARVLCLEKHGYNVVSVSKVDAVDHRELTEEGATEGESIPPASDAVGRSPQSESPPTEDASGVSFERNIAHSSPARSSQRSAEDTAVSGTTAASLSLHSPTDGDETPTSATATSAPPCAEPGRGKRLDQHPKHVQADFSVVVGSRGFVQELRSQWPTVLGAMAAEASTAKSQPPCSDLYFDTVMLDYFWLPHSTDWIQQGYLGNKGGLLENLATMAEAGFLRPGSQVLFPMNRPLFLALHSNASKLGGRFRAKMLFAGSPADWAELHPAVRSDQQIPATVMEQAYGKTKSFQLEHLGLQALRGSEKAMAMCYCSAWSDMQRLKQAKFLCLEAAEVPSQLPSVWDLPKVLGPPPDYARPKQRKLVKAAKAKAVSPKKRPAKRLAKRRKTQKKGPRSVKKQRKAKPRVRTAHCDSCKRLAGSRHVETGDPGRLWFCSDCIMCYEQTKILCPYCYRVPTATQKQMICVQGCPTCGRFYWETNDESPVVESVSESESDLAYPVPGHTPYYYFFQEQADRDLAARDALPTQRTIQALKRQTKDAWAATTRKRRWISQAHDDHYRFRREMETFRARLNCQEERVVLADARFALLESWARLRDPDYHNENEYYCHYELDLNHARASSSLPSSEQKHGSPSEAPEESSGRRDTGVCAMDAENAPMGGGCDGTGSAQAQPAPPPTGPFTVAAPVLEGHNVDGEKKRSHSVAMAHPSQPTHASDDEPQPKMRKLGTPNAL